MISWWGRGGGSEETIGGGRGRGAGGSVLCHVGGTNDGADEAAPPTEISNYMVWILVGGERGDEGGQGGVHLRTEPHTWTLHCVCCLSTSVSLSPAPH